LPHSVFVRGSVVELIADGVDGWLESRFLVVNRDILSVLFLKSVEDAHLMIIHFLSYLSCPIAQLGLESTFFHVWRLVLFVKSLFV
jgi:hypothetical protein